MKRLMIGFFVIAALTLSLGCKKTTNEDTASTSTSTIELKILSSTSSASASGQLAQAIGQATATQLSSLKYFIRDIKICKTLEVNGSGYSGQSGCLSLYTASVTADYDTYLAAEALADTTSYIDLMSSTGRAKLQKAVSLTETHVGSYNWGIIDWYRPVKVTAQVGLNDGTSLYTKTGRTTLVSGTGINAVYVTEADNMEVGPASESIIVLPNGGNWFKFQSPFVITAEDITAGTTFNLELAFNPEGIIKGYTQSTQTGLGIRDPVSQSVILVPMLDLVPIAHKAGDLVMKESYLLKYTGATITPLNIRLELYYLSSDTAKTVYGVEGKYLYTASSTGSVGEFYKTSYVTTAADGTLEFQDWAKTSFVTGFTRLTTAGDRSTAKLSCSATHGFGSCTTGSLDVTTELISVGAAQ